MTASIGARVKIEGDAKVGDKAVVGAGAVIWGSVYGTVGENSIVYRAATVRGVVGRRCTISTAATVDERAVVGDGVWVGESASIKAGAHVAKMVPVPAHAVVTPDMCASRRGDLVVVGMVGSEGNGRYVTVARQADNLARVIAGCWKNYRGGTVADLEARVDKTPWNRSDLNSNPLAGLYRVQYLGVIGLARELERLWATYPLPAPTTDDG